MRATPGTEFYFVKIQKQNLITKVAPIPALIISSTPCILICSITIVFNTIFHVKLIYYPFKKLRHPNRKLCGRVFGGVSPSTRHVFHKLHSYDNEMLICHVWSISSVNILYQIFHLGCIGHNVHMQTWGISPF